MKTKPELIILHGFSPSSFREFFPYVTNVIIVNNININYRLLVIQEENAPMGWGRPLVILLHSGDARQSCTCGFGSPGGDSLHSTFLSATLEAEYITCVPVPASSDANSATHTVAAPSGAGL
jgi:hypothetical protein